MKEEQQKSCLVCEGKETTLYICLKDYSISGEEFELIQCSSCGFLWTGKLPEEGEIGKYYKSSNYISHSDTKEGIINRLYHVIRNRMLYKKLRLIQDLNQGRKLLDIGTGTGYFLDYMRREGYQTVGIEMNEEARNISNRKFGLKVHKPVELFQWKEEKTFDVVTMWHVLEHLYEPYSYVRKIHELMDKNGVLVIAVPNHNSYDAKYYGHYWAGYDVPRHLWHFTPNTLKQFAENAGFHVESLCRLPYDAFYNSMLSEKYQSHSLSLMRGSVIGSISTGHSLLDKRKTSSLIYILRKK